MTISLQAPPKSKNIDELYQWCYRLWQWLQVPERPCFLVSKSTDQSNFAVGSWVTVT